MGSGFGASQIEWIRDRLATVLAADQLSQARYVSEFESEFARLVGRRHALAVASGSFVVWHAVRSAPRTARPFEPVLSRPVRAGGPCGSAPAEAAGPDEADDAVVAAGERALAAGRRARPASARPWRDPLDLEYVRASALTRRVTNVLWSMRGRRPCAADGVSHRRLFRRLVLRGLG